MTVEFQRKKLIEICKLINGRAYSKPELLAEGKYPVLRVGNFFTNDHWYYSDLELDEGKYCDKGDLLYAWSASFGPRIWHAGKVIYHYHIWKVIPDLTLIDKKFLFYFFEWDADQIKKDQGAGTTMVHVSKGSMENREINLPQLKDQARIVTLLDEAFADITTAKVNAEKNLQNSRNIFESHLESVFSDRDNGWVKNPLKSITKKIGSGATPRGGQESYKSDGVSLIRSLNVHDFAFKYAKLAFLDELQAADLSNVEVHQRDVLLNITGASVARCCVVPEDILPARVNQHVSIIRPLEKILMPEFLHYLIISRPYKSKLLQTGEEGGSTRQAITKAQIQDFTVSYPASIEEQQTLVTRLNSMLAETQRLESIYQEKLIALDDLKKALLHQAFNGKL